MWPNVRYPLDFLEYKCALIISMFRSTPAERLASLMKQGKLYTVDKGEVILSTDDNRSLQMVKTGYIKRYQITNAGNTSVQSIYGPHDIFPLTYAFEILLDKSIYSGPETYYYEAMCKSELYSIEGEALMDAVSKDPMLYKDLFDVSGERFRSNIQQLENISLSVYYKRVAHQLWFYANKFSDKKGNRAKLKIPLTQQDLADVLSTTRETVSLCMSDIKKKGLIKSGKFITVINIEKLKEEAFK
jgi:CRP/FNR family cyclic AMP-dependent transcriptional regulator